MGSVTRWIRDGHGLENDQSLYGPRLHANLFGGFSHTRFWSKEVRHQGGRVFLFISTVSGGTGQLPFWLPFFGRLSKFVLVPQGGLRLSGKVKVANSDKGCLVVGMVRKAVDLLARSFNHFWWSIQHTHTLSLGLFDGCHTVQEVNKIRVRKSRRNAHRSRGLTALHNGKGRPQQQDGEAIPGKPLIFLHFSPPSPVTSVFYSCLFITINSFGVYFMCLLTQLHLLRFLISALQSSFLYWCAETAPHLLPTSFSFSE